MNNFFIVYEESTGKIFKTLFMPESDVHMNYNEDEGESYITGEGYYERHYVHEGKITLRPENPSTLNGTAINNVPPNSTVRIDGVDYEAKEGGDIELRFNQIGVYKIEIESFPYLDKEFTIDYQP